MMKVKQHSEWLSNRKIYQRAKINEISIMAPLECWRYSCTDVDRKLESSVFK